MDDDLMASDVVQDALVSSGLAPYIVVLGKAIHRHYQVQARERRPMRRDGPHGACYQLHLETHPIQSRQQGVQFAITDERFAAHDGQMQRPVSPHERENAFHEGVALVVRDLPQGQAVSEVIFFVRITAWAT
jgi:hypothetical protein